MPNHQSVIVLFDADDLACVEAKCPEALSGEVVAFQTEMHLILDERGIRHSTPWTFVSRKDRPELEALEADIWRHWTRHARIEFDGINLLNMAAFRHVAAFARLAWAVFSIRRVLERCQPAQVYAFDEPPAHGLDQPPGYLKMPLLSGVLRGLAEQAGLDVRLVPRLGPDGGEGFVDQVAERGSSIHPPVDSDAALRGQPFVLFNGNGAELVRQLPLIQEIQQRMGHQVVQLYKDADASHLGQLRHGGHFVWHESQVICPGPLLDIERTTRNACETFDAAGRDTVGHLGALFNNPHVACHFDFLFGEYARKMAEHVRTWKRFFARHRPAAFLANYHAPIYDVAAAVGIPCLGLPHGPMMQGLPRWFSTLPPRSLVGALSERHRRSLVADGMAPERLRVTGDPCGNLNHRARINEAPEPHASARANHPKPHASARANHPKPHASARASRPEPQALACANRSERGCCNSTHGDIAGAARGRRDTQDCSPEDLRRQLNLAPDRRIILLCTTSLGMPSHLPHLPLVDWAEAVRCTFDLARLAERHEDWIFLIKQHPRYDHPALYAAVNRTLPPERRLILLPEGPLAPWAAAADVVCIWNSVTSAIVQASMSGTPVVVFSKAMLWYDAETWGCEAWPHINDLEPFEAALEQLFNDPGHYEEQVRQTRRAALGYLEATADTAVDRCTEVLNEFLRGQKQTDVVNTLETNKANLASFDSLSPYPLRPFWDIPELGDDPFWGPPLREASSSKTLLVVSGPARNGNHLLHSMLDDHPQLPRSPGEDSFLAAFFEDLRRDRNEARRNLTGPENVDYMLSLSGFGHNKWKTRHEMSREAAGQTTSIWAGIQDGVRTSVADYQDTMVAVDYPAYESRLHENAEAIRRAPTFMDALWLYLDAFARLDPRRRTGHFDYLYVGSGMRAELKFVLDRSDRVRCVTPVRPFESYYYSFARARNGSDAVSEPVLQEAWEHWWHKVVDYLLLMREFSDRVCMVSFVHLVEEPEPSSREICRFLDVAYDDSCLSPTSLGRATKGNSSFPKEEQDRGRLYKTPLERSLPKAHWPELYPALWEMVSKLSI